MQARKLQITIDSALLAEIDEATSELDMSRSALIRSALIEYLQRIRQRRLDRLDREAYERRPASDEDSEFWEAVQIWIAP